MKKFLFFVFCTLLCARLVAAERDTFPDIKPGEHTELTFWGEYGFNDVWGHHGNFDLMAKVPVHKHFDLTTGLQLSTANVYNFNLELDTKFLLTQKRHREMYLKSRFLFRGVQRAQAYEFNLTFGLGYRQDYFDLMLGTNIRMMDEMKRNTMTSASEMIAETFYVLYGLEVFGRPRDCNWNVSVKVSNYTEFQVERMYNPIFSLCGYYEPTPNWRVLAKAVCKPIGMGNMTGSFFDARGIVGFTYIF